jgi:hypothetical protein
MLKTSTTQTQFTKMMKYTVTWNMPYQGQGNSTKASASYDLAEGAYRKLVAAQCEPGCSGARCVNASGVRVSERQLRAWAKIK